MSPAVRALPVAVTSVLLGAVLAVAGPVDARAQDVPFVHELVDLLVVGPPTASSPFDPAAFEHWTDDDRDGCDTGEAVLIRQSRGETTVDSSCRVVAGSWSTWTGTEVTSGEDVQAAPLIPWEEAWRSGASAWTPAQRRAFANDLAFDRTLTVLTGEEERLRAAQDPAGWQPAPQLRARYAIEWALVKYRWNLSADPAEVAALRAAVPAASSGVALPVRMDVPPPVAAPVSGPVMRHGQQLASGQALTSADGRYTFVMQADGNLVLYAPGRRVLWSSHTYGRPGAVFRLEVDGAAVVRAPGGQELWNSGSAGGLASTLQVQDDGNVVLHRRNNAVGWYSGWDRWTLTPGQQLTTGQQVTSPDGRYWLVLQPDGNAVVYVSATGRPVFATGSYGAARLVVQGDGNLVAYRSDGVALWSSGTWQEGPSTLAMQDDGNLVLYRRDGSPSWYSGWDTGRWATGPSDGTIVPRRR
ncbi:hypothetical protein [Modestobacter sp. SSW1-42]|uniref:hypothetical protein n=1 Tax=Modestobacter sp. SSW1-42 TaxID=596372 RepID=UPI0039886E08